MTSTRKYAALPDLDSAPDIYETSELTDDISTLPTARSISPSSSSYKDGDDASNENERISHQHLRPDQARSYFSPARVDAREVDFSDRIGEKRRSYRTYSRRRRRRQWRGSDGPGEQAVYGHFSEDEDEGDEEDADSEEEGLKRRIARLMREVEEVKDKIGRNKAEKQEKGGLKGTGAVDEDDKEDGVAALSRVLDNLQVLQDAAAAEAEGGSSSAEPHFREKLTHRHLTVTEDPALDASSSVDSRISNGVIPTPSTSTTSTLLAKSTSAFDIRLTAIENALGLSQPSISSPPTHPSKPILPTLTHLQQLLDSISQISNNPSTLDKLSQHIHQLTTTSLAAPTTTTDPTNEQDQNTKAIQELYAHLPHLTRLSPLLPPLIDRLRSLRVLHATAAQASQTLEEAEANQGLMEEEIERWKKGLERAEGLIVDGEKVMRSNQDVVEGWVRGLESRLAALDGGGGGGGSNSNQ